MLVNPKQFLTKALKGNYAVPAFNINNMEILQAVVDAAVAERSPVIVQTSEGALEYAGSPSFGSKSWRAGLEYLAAIVQTAAKLNPKIPIAFHLDHGKNFKLVKEMIRMGYHTSVMYDGSALPFKENIKKTKEIVKQAHAKKIFVEAELGPIPGQEDLVNVKARDAYFTDPDKVTEFIRETNCDALAISIGTAHGAYKFKQEAHLNFDLLRKIKKQTRIPLVLHGASEVPNDLVALANKFGATLGGAKGVSNRLLKHAVRCGINKVNIDTDLRIAFDAGVRKVVKTKPSVFDPRKILGPAKDLMQREARDKMRLLGSNRKA